VSTHITIWSGFWALALITGGATNIVCRLVSTSDTRSSAMDPFFLEILTSDILSLQTPVNISDTGDDGTAVDAPWQKNQKQIQKSVSTASPRTKPQVDNRTPNLARLNTRQYRR